MELTTFEEKILELARRVWKKRSDASKLILTHGSEFGPVSAEGWFTIELMILLKKEGYNVHKVQRPGDIIVESRDIIGEGKKVEIRASSVHKYTHIINGWKNGIDFLLFGGIINQKDEEKLIARAKEKGWKSWIVRINYDVAVGLLKEDKITSR